MWRLLLAYRVDGVPQIMVAALSQQILRVGSPPALIYACVVFLLSQSTELSKFVRGHVEVFRRVTIGDVTVRDDFRLFCSVCDLKNVSIIQYSTALHCTALHCTALHCTALHCTALHCTALHCTALHCSKMVQKIIIIFLLLSSRYIFVIAEWIT